MKIDRRNVRQDVDKVGGFGPQYKANDEEELISPTLRTSIMHPKNISSTTQEV